MQSILRDQYKGSLKEQLFFYEKEERGLFFFNISPLIIKKHSRAFGTLLPNIVNISNGDFYMREYETVHDVMLHLSSLMDMEKHSDNERSCNPLDPFQLDEYLTIYSRGCCGFYDAMVFINPLLNKEGYDKNDSHPFLIGFNYNH